MGPMGGRFAHLSEEERCEAYRIVAQLRRALGDDASNPRYIQTLHGRGYRFMVQPEKLDGADGASEPDGAASNGDATQEHRSSPHH